MSTIGSRTVRRELVLAVAGCALAGAVVLFCAGRRWVGYVVSGGGHVSGGVSGHYAAAGSSAFGLVLLAATVALVATRQLPRRLVGLVVAAAGVGTVLLAAHVLVDPSVAAGGPHYLGFTSYSPNPTVSLRVTAWPWIAACAGALAVVVGIVVIVRSGGWPAMGRRYESGGKRVGADAGASMWDRLDEGDDPTA